MNRDSPWSQEVWKHNLGNNALWILPCSQANDYIVLFNYRIVASYSILPSQVLIFLNLHSPLTIMSLISLFLCVNHFQSEMLTHGGTEVKETLFMSEKLIPCNLKPSCTTIYLTPLTSGLCPTARPWQVESHVSVRTVNLSHCSFLASLSLLAHLTLLAQFFKTSEKAKYSPWCPPSFNMVALLMPFSSCSNLSTPSPLPPSPSFLLSHFSFSPSRHTKSTSLLSFWPFSFILMSLWHTNSHRYVNPIWLFPSLGGWVTSKLL